MSQFFSSGHSKFSTGTPTVAVEPEIQNYTQCLYRFSAKDSVFSKIIQPVDTSSPQKSCGKFGFLELKKIT